MTIEDDTMKRPPIPRGDKAGGDIAGYMPGHEVEEEDEPAARQAPQPPQRRDVGDGRW